MQCMQRLEMLSFPLRARAQALRTLCIQGLKKSVISRGLVVHARAQKCCAFQGRSILQFPGMQLFRESLCTQEAKVLQFPGSCDFQDFVHARLHILQFPGNLCMQELDVLHFPGLCARKGSKCCSKCFTFQGFCARKGSTCFNLLFRELPDNWAPKNTK